MKPKPANTTKPPTPPELQDIRLPAIPSNLRVFTDMDNEDEWETLAAIVRNYARHCVWLDREAREKARAT